MYVKNYVLVINNYVLSYLLKKSVNGKLTLNKYKLKLTYYFNFKNKKTYN